MCTVVAAWWQNNEAYTITFGDRAENEKGMQIIGTPASHGRVHVLVRRRPLRHVRG